jgi:hypothetical protein
MAKKKRQKSEKQTPKKPQVPDTNEPWLSKRTGLIVISVISIAFASYMIWQLRPVLGLSEALLWGLGYGAAIWGVFALALAFNRWVRRRK